MGRSTTNIIFLGDINAQIGDSKDGESRVMGNHGYGSRNKRGEKFINFCLQNNLKIANTMFKKSPKLRWTWLAPDNRTKNEIDFIATNTPHLIQNCSVLSNLKHPSDHRLVRATLNINSKNSTRTNFMTKPQKHINFEKYSTELDKYKYEDPGNKSVQEYYECIENTIIKSSSKARISKKTLRKQAIVTEQIKELIEQRHTLKNKNNKSRLEKKTT